MNDINKLLKSIRRVSAKEPVTQLQLSEIIRGLWRDPSLTSEIIITQQEHGFVVGNTIKPTTTGWVKTKADVAENAGTVCLVKEVIDADHFKIIGGGLLPGEYEVGAKYFLSSESEGEITVKLIDDFSDGEFVEFIGTGSELGLFIEIDFGFTYKDSESTPIFYFQNGDKQIKIVLGSYYNGYCITDPRGLAAPGFHVPTSNEWNQLFESVDATTDGLNYLVSGGKLKQQGTNNWNYENVGATDEFDFGALGGGFRTCFGNFDQVRDYGWYACGDVSETNNVATLFYRYGTSAYSGPSLPNVDGFGTIHNPMNFALSVRLVKDSTDLAEGEYGEYEGNDGTIYRTRCIGGVEWMLENLMETRWRDGSLIHEIPYDPSFYVWPYDYGSTEWYTTTEPAWCRYPYGTAYYIETNTYELYQGDTLRIITEHNRLDGIQGDTENEYYHLNNQQFNKLKNIPDEVASTTHDHDLGDLTLLFENNLV